MEFITESERQTGIAEECDVLVAGGGVAGIAAALAAARSGANVLLVERECTLGGLATLGLITIYLPLCDGMGRQVIFGIGEELLRLSIRYGAEGKRPEAWLSNGTAQEREKERFQVQYNPCLFAVAAEQLLRREGVRILYHTMICGVHRVCDKINAAIVENKSGRSAIRLKSVVDATGDADICSLSGAKTERFAQKNVLASWYYYHSKGDVKLKMLGFADTPDEYRTKDTPKPLIEKRFTGLDGAELSDMMVLSHGEMLKDVLNNRRTDAEYTPVTMPAIPQIRMTRRISGAYTLDDKEMHKDFKDSVGMTGDWRKRGPIYQIPFRTLYGNEIKNLITAGRCISVTDPMWDITRVIPSCAVTGQAAGTAASMTDDFTRLDTRLLQNRLTDSGVRLAEK
jgi:hypothetical protein